MRESNPQLNLGRVACYHYTNNAAIVEMAAEQMIYKSLGLFSRFRPHLGSETCESGGLGKHYRRTDKSKGDSCSTLQSLTLLFITMSCHR